MATKFDAIMARRGEIMRKALGMDYSEFELSPIAFDYERMMTSGGYSLDEIVAIQGRAGVGSTPRAWRMNSGMSSRPSRAASVCDTPDCVMPTTAAVRCTLPSSASWSSTCNCRSLPRASRRFSSEVAFGNDISEFVMDHAEFWLVTEC